MTTSATAPEATTAMRMLFDADGTPDPATAALHTAVVGSGATSAALRAARRLSSATVRMVDGDVAGMARDFSTSTWAGCWWGRGVAMPTSRTRRGGPSRHRAARRSWRWRRTGSARPTSPGWICGWMANGFTRSGFARDRPGRHRRRGRRARGASGSAPRRCVRRLAVPVPGRRALGAAGAPVGAVAAGAAGSARGAAAVRDDDRVGVTPARAGTRA